MSSILQPNTQYFCVVLKLGIHSLPIEQCSYLVPKVCFPFMFLFWYCVHPPFPFFEISLFMKFSKKVYILQKNFLKSEISKKKCNDRWTQYKKVLLLSVLLQMSFLSVRNACSVRLTKPTSNKLEWIFRIHSTSAVNIRHTLVIWEITVWLACDLNIQSAYFLHQPTH